MTGTYAMRPLLIVLLIAALAGCASVHGDRHGYYRGEAHGDYYYDAAPRHHVNTGWYGPYDTLFWDLRYSYFDPFWYPGFYYGVTFFPRYYHVGWPHRYGGWYGNWRWYHPYAPYLGSYWDHYYAWRKPPPARPLRRVDDPARSGVGSGPPRYGSARNAAERMARSGGRAGLVQGPTSADRLGVSHAGGPGYRADGQWQRLPSSRYAPREDNPYARGPAFDRAAMGSEPARFQSPREAAGRDWSPDRAGAGHSRAPIGTVRQEPALERGARPAAPVRPATRSDWQRPAPQRAPMRSREGPRPERAPARSHRDPGGRQP